MPFEHFDWGLEPENSVLFGSPRWFWVILCQSYLFGRLRRPFGWSLTPLAGVSRRPYASVSLCKFLCVRVLMLMRASMYASSCMCAVARMCAWFSACFSVLSLACMLTPTSVFATVFVYVLLCVCFVQDCVCVSAKARQHHPWVMSKGLCPRSWVSENQARAERARRF